MTSITTLIASLGFGTTVTLCGVYGQQLIRLHHLGVESVPVDAWSSAIIVAALATVSLVIRALMAERRSSAAMQAKATHEVAQAKIKADEETVARLRQIEDDRAALVRMLAETVTKNTIVMEQQADLLTQLAKSIDKNTRVLAEMVTRFPPRDGKTSES